MITTHLIMFFFNLIGQTTHKGFASASDALTFGAVGADMLVGSASTSNQIINGAAVSDG